MTIPIIPYTLVTGANGTVCASTNGSSFTAYSVGTTETLNGAIGGIVGDAAIVVGDGGVIYTSGTGNPPNFSSWTAQSSGTSSNLNSIAGKLDGDLSIFVAVGDGGVCTINTDGSATSWTVQSTIGGGANMNSICYDVDNALFVACGNGGVIVTSPDGVTWTTQTSGTTKDLLQAFSNTIQVVGSATAWVVGKDGTLLSTTDDVTWSAV